MFPLGWRRVISFDLLGRGQCVCLRQFHPQRSRRFCLVKHYYEASIPTSGFERRVGVFRIEKHEFLWADCTRWSLHCSNRPLKCHGFAVRGYENPPTTSEDTQPQLWHGEGMVEILQEVQWQISPPSPRYCQSNEPIVLICVFVKVSANPSLRVRSDPKKILGKTSGTRVFTSNKP